MSVYLIALELDPATVGQQYNSLPLHCTLMHWFRFDGGPALLQDTLTKVLSSQKPITLTGTETHEYGPLLVVATMVRLTDELTTLHTNLYRSLNDLGVRYVEPAWVGDGFEAHVTKQGETMLQAGESKASSTAFLVVAEGPEYQYPRTVIARFSLP